MYILIIILMTAQGVPTAVETQEMTNASTCYDAKVAIEQSIPVANYRTVSCKPK